MQLQLQLNELLAKVDSICDGDEDLAAAKAAQGASGQFSLQRELQKSQKATRLWIPGLPPLWQGFLRCSAPCTRFNLRR